jgi:branched-chain amino acid transport system ATP-binding protein
MADDGPSALTIESVSAGYGNLTVLHEVSMHIPRGAATAVLGLNGAGKTTLARAVSGFLRVRSGRLLLDGTDYTNQNPSRTARRGLIHVLDDRQLFGDLSVRENLLLASRAGNASVKASPDLLDSIYEILPRLKERHRQVAGSLSGGEQQMLALGRALACRPRVLILDEPSTGLSPALTDEVYNALAQLRQTDLAIMLIEQDVRRAVGFADHVYVLTSGQVSAAGPASAFADQAEIANLLFSGRAD